MKTLKNIFFSLLLLNLIKKVFYTSLTHFSPVLHLYTPWKRQSFLTFSGGIEMWHWTKWVNAILICLQGALPKKQLIASFFKHLKGNSWKHLKLIFQSHISKFKIFHTLFYWLSIWIYRKELSITKIILGKF